MPTLDAIVRFLDRELKVGAFQDSSHNGLQVANPGAVRKICCGVDASLQFFQEACRRGADLLICHHGISWDDSLKRITEINYGRLAFLIQHNLALYACHIPLDAHPRYGNNIQICRALKLRRIRKFGNYHGQVIGFAGELPRTMPYADFKKLAERICGNRIRSLDFGRRQVRTVAVVSGGAGDLIAEAGQKRFDVYLSGEPQLLAYHLAQEYRINAIFAGHYATETFGVRALAKLLRQRFKIPAEFIDLQIPY
jgi:dinuclear metal center YbgI/SA1388 family protein